MADLGPPASLEGALERLQSILSAERYLILWKPKQGDFQVLQAAGIDPERALTTEPVSFSIFEEVAATQSVRWSGDAEHAPSNSLLLAGIRSYICLPLKVPDGLVLFYGDDRKTAGRFSYADLLNVHNLAQKMHPIQSRRESPPPLPKKAPAQASTLFNSAARPQLLSLREQASLFRNLHAFTSAGVPILVGLQGLSEKGETRALLHLTNALSGHILRGNRLSDGFEKLARVDKLVVPLLKAAENSGRLSEIFRLLAAHLDEKYNRLMYLRSSLVYPGVVLSGGVAFALAVPPLVLRDQLLSYQRNGPLPLPTKLLLGMSTPWFWLILLLAAGTLWKLCQLPRAPFLTPWTRRVFCAKCEVQLATALSIQLESGVNLISAVETAIDACDSALVSARAPEVLRTIKDGTELSKAFRLLPAIRPGFCSMLAAGEKVGKVTEALKWCTRMSKIEYDRSLDAATKMMEPLVMMILGIIVGIMGVGSLLPTMDLLNQ